MPVAEHTRHRLSTWCAERVPVVERHRRQISYTIQGDTITILDRRAPTFPELDAEWSSQPVAQLRQENTSAGTWTLYRRSESNEWRHSGVTGDDPIAMLDKVRG